MIFFRKFEKFNNDQIEAGDLIYFESETNIEDYLYEVIEVSLDVEYLMKKYKDFFWELPENNNNLTPNKDVKRVIYMREHYKQEWAAVRRLSPKIVTVLNRDVRIEPLYSNFPIETDYLPFKIYMKKMDPIKRDTLKDYGILDT